MAVVGTPPLRPALVHCVGYRLQLPHAVPALVSEELRQGPGALSNGLNLHCSWPILAAWGLSVFRPGVDLALRSHDGTLVTSAPAGSLKAAVRLDLE
jgi:hypothetical protein